MVTKFNVATDDIVEFVEILTENELANEIIGTTYDNKLIIEVEYSRHERDAVNELMDLVDSEESEEEED